MNFFTSYKSIIKEASLFSGVQIILLIVTMIRSMIISRYFGVEAMGVLGNLQSIIGVFVTICGLGLPVLLMKSFTETQTEQVLKRQLIIKNSLIFLGILGTLFFLLVIPFFSKEVFKHDGYEWILKIASVVILFKQFSSINLALLQGQQQLNKLAKVSVLSSVLSLIISIPLYFYYNLKGIIFGFIIMYLTEVVVSFFAVKNNRKNKNYIPSFNLNNYLTTFKEGFILGYGNVLTLVSQFVVLIFITSYSGNYQAGLYTAGFAIINNYVALLFVVMSTGYLPRIMKIVTNKEDLQIEISKQINFSLVVVGSLASLCIIFASLIVNILYSKAFDEVIPFLQLAIFGIIFKSFSWCLGYLIIAKVDKKVLMFTGCIFNMLFTLMLIYGFYVKEIIGVAYAFVIYNFLHFVSVSLIVRFRYFVKIEKATILFLIVILSFNALLLL